MKNTKEILQKLSKEPNAKSLINLIGKGITHMAAEKNESYNNSYSRTDEFLKLIFPDGIPVEKYSMIAPIVRWWDKTNRMISKPNAYGESPRIDMVGYAILDAVKDIQDMLERGEEPNLDGIFNEKNPLENYINE